MTKFDVEAEFRGANLVLSHWEELSRMSRSERKSWVRRIRDLALPQVEPLIVKNGPYDVDSYLVQSSKDQARFYRVEFCGEWLCNCYSFRGGSCKHVLSVRKFQESKGNN